MSSINPYISQYFGFLETDWSFLVSDGVSLKNVQLVFAFDTFFHIFHDLYFLMQFTLKKKQMSFEMKNCETHYRGEGLLFTCCFAVSNRFLKHLLKVSYKSLTSLQ